MNYYFAYYLAFRCILLHIHWHISDLQTRSGALTVDPWADLLLNDSRYAGATRHASYDAITNIVALLASSHGISSAACLQLVPIAEPDTMQRYDLVVSARGILSARPNCQIPPNRIMDFTLGHTYTSRHILKHNALDTMEHDKCEFYTSRYQEQGLAFAPLAANTFGSVLRFLWALADHTTRNYVPVPVSVLPVLSDAPLCYDHNSPQVVRFKRLRRSGGTIPVSALGWSFHCPSYSLLPLSSHRPANSFSPAPCRQPSSSGRCSPFFAPSGFFAARDAGRLLQLSWRLVSQSSWLLQFGPLLFLVALNFLGSTKLVYYMDEIQEINNTPHLPMGEGLPVAIRPSG